MLKNHALKYFVSVFISLYLGHHLAAQDRLLVITDKLNIHERPDATSALLGTLALGDSVMVIDYTKNKTTATINELAVRGAWAQIEYRGKAAWVFGGGLCYMMVNPQYWQAPYPKHDSLKMRKDLDQLLKEGTLTVGGNYLRFKAKNGKSVYVYECVCLHESIGCRDGYNITSLVINPSNPNIVEVEMSVTAYSVKIYIDLRNGTKFNFPPDQDCMISEISPSAKYIIGLSMASPRRQVLLFDVMGKKLLNQAYVDSFGDISDLKWLNDQEVVLQRLNYETNQIVKERVLLIPSMQWKK